MLVLSSINYSKWIIFCAHNRSKNCPDTKLSIVTLSVGLCVGIILVSYQLCNYTASGSLSKLACTSSLMLCSNQEKCVCFEPDGCILISFCTQVGLNKCIYMEKPLYDQKLSRAYVHGLTQITGPLHLHMEKTGFVRLQSR